MKLNTNMSNQISDFSMKLVDPNCKDIYAPFNNSCNFAYYTNKKIYTEPYANDANVLEKPSYLDGDKLRQFDCTVSFPPMGVRNTLNNLEHDKYNRFKIYKGKSSLDVAHFEHILAQTKKRAIVLMPVGFTFRSGIEEKFRQYLVNENLLEGIIQLPPNLHNSTSIETTFFIINREKKDDKVFFLNLRGEQFIEKDGRRIVLKDLDYIVNIYKNHDNLENISSTVRNKQIVDNNYLLTINRYVVSKEINELNNRLSKYKLVKLQDIAEIRKSQLFKDEEKGVKTYELSPSDFNKVGFTKESGKIKHIEAQYKKYETYKLLRNDILLSTKGTIGKVAIIGDINEQMLTSQASQVIRVNSAVINPIVLYMFFKSKIGQGLLMKLVSGTVMPQVTTKEIKEFRIPIFSLREQEKIVDYFYKEIKIFKKINELHREIDNIHNDFLGEN